MGALTAPAPRTNYGTVIPPGTWAAGTNVIFYKGCIVILKSDGYAYPGVTVTGAKYLGVCEFDLDMTGVAVGTKSVVVRPGTFGDFANSADADQIDFDDRQKTIYVVDDATWALTDGGGTRSAPATCYDIADDGSSVVVQGEVIR